MKNLSDRRKDQEQEYNETIVRALQRLGVTAVVVENGFVKLVLTDLHGKTNTYVARATEARYLWADRQLGTIAAVASQMWQNAFAHRLVTPT